MRGAFVVLGTMLEVAIAPILFDGPGGRVDTSGRNGGNRVTLRMRVSFAALAFLVLLAAACGSSSISAERPPLTAETFTEWFDAVYEVVATCGSSSALTDRAVQSVSSDGVKSTFDLDLVTAAGAAAESCFWTPDPATTTQFAAEIPERLLPVTIQLEEWLDLSDAANRAFLLVAAGNLDDRRFIADAIEATNAADALADEIGASVDQLAAEVEVVLPDEAMMFRWSIESHS